MKNFKKSFMPAYFIAQELMSKHSLPLRIVRNALDIYALLIRKKGTRGRNRETLIKACILIAAENMNAPLLIKSWRTKQILRQKRHIRRVLGIKPRQIESHMYVSLLSYKLGLAEQDISKALELVCDKHGVGFACAAIHLACGISLRKLARLTGLSRNYILRLKKLLA